MIQKITWFIKICLNKLFKMISQEQYLSREITYAMSKFRFWELPFNSQLIESLFNIIPASTNGVVLGYKPQASKSKHSTWLTPVEPAWRQRQGLHHRFQLPRNNRPENCHRLILFQLQWAEAVVSNVERNLYAVLTIVWTSGFTSGGYISFGPRFHFLLHLLLLVFHFRTTTLYTLLLFIKADESQN